MQRSASIQAPPEKIFPLINDLRRFNTWNPFDKKDPNLKDVGRGSIEIIDSVPASEVRMNLNMLAPMEASNVVEFSLKPDGQGLALRGPSRDRCRSLRKSSACSATWMA